MRGLSSSINAILIVPEKLELFDECGQEEFMHDPSPNHVVKVEVGCGYDASKSLERKEKGKVSLRYRNKMIALVHEAWEYPGHKRLKHTVEIKDVTEHVLPFLPAKTLSRFRAVRKEWDDLITSLFLMH
ncbi:hypothetical protein DVH24_029879 [Malus domestica]|uniref:F-box domain-containing protein n=1 Tax=Malus domestica TaxID=3750 RepID=A0A498HU89_MALDO|nr:hypothetical protein DVH24_029879 [Malus domestica]